MNYHDDGERGLGSVVASISLGADATMSFRRKEKKSKKKRNDSEPTPRGCKISLRLKLRHGDICIMEVSHLFSNSYTGIDSTSIGLARDPRCKNCSSTLSNLRVYDSVSLYSTCVRV